MHYRRKGKTKNLPTVDLVGKKAGLKPYWTEVKVGGNPWLTVHERRMGRVARTKEAL